MKQLLLFVLCLAVLFSLGACQPATPQEAQGIQVVTTIFPTYDFARQVAGDLADVTLLLPPGAESHSYEPTPQDILKIQGCDLFIYVGGSSDSWIGQVLSSMDTSDMTIIALVDTVETVPEELVEGMEEEEEDDHDHDHSDQYENDEHVWTSPENAMEIVRAINASLQEIDKENAVSYQLNADAYLKELGQLDQEYAKAVGEAKRNVIVFADRFPFRYLADAYGLSYFAAFPGCSAQAEPSAATVRFLIDKVRQEEIPVVFHIEFSNEKMADTICESTMAQKRLLHSCHNVTQAQIDEGVGYISLMQENLEALKEALN